MHFEYSYSGNSNVRNTGNSTGISFAPDLLREPTFFRGQLAKSLEFREAISSLHDVVISDLRWKPKDREAYMEWRQQQDEVDWALIAAQRAETAAKINEVRAELDGLRAASRQRMSTFYDARGRYYKYLYENDRDAWIVLDPVITVHPDEVFFECFSQDESSYGRLSVDFDVFKNVGEFACGTTNVDYSAALYDEFQKIRTYKDSSFEIDPSGFEVKTEGEAAYKEVKIDLPDTWVRGFLQVSSAMGLPMVKFDLHPMDLHNICFVLRRHKELIGPRSLRYILRPGEPVKIVFDPWNKELVCPRSVYHGEREHEIRVWGRRRLHILERLVAQAKKFTVHLLGTGMPSFYLADLGDMTFTLGLSGWTTNDWSRAGNFDLLAPRANVDSSTQQQVFAALRETWFATPESLAAKLGLDRKIILGSLGAYTQGGRAIWDLNKNVFRARELSREPLPIDKLRFTSERETTAATMLENKAVKLKKTESIADGAIRLTGKVKDKNRTEEVALIIDADERLSRGTCTCNFVQQNAMRKGPCEHMLGLRMAHSHNAQSTLWEKIFN